MNTDGIREGERGESIGFIQVYVVMGSGDGWWEQETDPGARGIDQLLANNETVTKVQADPAPENQRAIRCYQRAGFMSVGEVITPNGTALLMVKQC